MFGVFWGLSSVSDFSQCFVLFTIFGVNTKFGYVWPILSGLSLKSLQKGSPNSDKPEFGFFGVPQKAPWHVGVHPTRASPTKVKDSQF